MNESQGKKLKIKLMASILMNVLLLAYVFYVLNYVKITLKEIHERDERREGVYEKLIKSQESAPTTNINRP